MDEFLFWFAEAKRDKGILYYSEFLGYLVPMFQAELEDNEMEIIIDFRNK